MVRMTGFEPAASGPQDQRDNQTTLHPDVGAGDGNRTRVPSLEGWCSTIELRRRRSQPEFHRSRYCGQRFTGCRYRKEVLYELSLGMGNSPMQASSRFYTTPSPNRHGGFLFAYQSILLLTEEAFKVNFRCVEFRKLLLVVEFKIIIAPDERISANPVFISTAKITPCHTTNCRMCAGARTS